MHVGLVLVSAGCARAVQNLHGYGLLSSQCQHAEFETSVQSGPLLLLL